MARYSQESVQRLREAVDIVDLISRYVKLKKAGISYKGRCPFHDEKTPSFTVNKATNHYHCFGCGAHGDALAFLMQHERLDFKQALEFLSERFGIHLDVEHEEAGPKGVPKARLRALLESSSRFFHLLLLYADEAEGARTYLARRGFSYSFLRSFGIGYSSATPGQLTRFLATQGFSEKEMEEAGLITVHNGRTREFFSERITFPILDTMGNTIGFSARKWREETYGGKYINTPETSLFKKSKVFFGLFYSKKRMMRDRFACIVEGQLDALRLIEAGFDFTVASLGTAFGPTHVEQLKAMGIEEVFLSFDQDEAGLVSAEKAGSLLLKKGIGVRVLRFTGAKDPDELLSSQGKGAFFRALTSGVEYVQFLVDRAKSVAVWSSPREKDQAVRHIAERIREWENPILVHEALKQLAVLADVPETVLNISQQPNAGALIPSLPQITTPHDLLLEIDLIRWVLFAGPEQPELVSYCKNTLQVNHFAHPITQKLYESAMRQLEAGESPDFMSLCSEVDLEPISQALQVVFTRRQHLERAFASVEEAVIQLRARAKTKAIEEVRQKMQDPSLSEAELTELSKRAAELAKVT